jgi:threonine synthase
MRYLSTRGGYATDLSGAVMQGLAADGGLYVPEELPRVAAQALRGESLVEIASEVLAPFFSGSWLEPELGDICRDALDFPVPLIPLRDAPEALSVLELFHGPTGAFKDVGARFLAAMMERVLERETAEAGGAARPVTILVATSGDTGGAVAAAFHRRKHVRVAVLFPRGHVSPRQEKQLTCWGDNVRSFEVEGSFDEWQALIKRAFTDPELSSRHRLSGEQLGSPDLDSRHTGSPDSIARRWRLQNALGVTTATPKLSRDVYEIASKSLKARP